MNIEFANRLASLRKEKGLSQEELAEKLGVSRQAVSKWECGESSPDTDNLVALAKIYGVSLDELVNNPAPAKEKEVEAEVVEDAEVVDEDEIEEKLEKAHKQFTFAKWVNAIGFPLMVIAYLIVGFTWKNPDGAPVGWAAGWVLFLLPIVVLSLASAIHDRKMSHFQIAVLVVMVYCGMGITGSYYGQNFWHPFWVEFLAIPVYHGIASIVDHKK